MDTELKTQAPIIENLRDEMEKNTMKMVKLDNRLKESVTLTDVAKKCHQIWQKVMAWKDTF